MKGEQREQWLDRCEENQPLCVFCRYFETWRGEPECTHALEAVNERQFEMAMEGCDCWAFRPDADARQALSRERKESA